MALKAIAWRKSSRPTMSTVKDWRAGVSTAVMMPSTSASTMMVLISILPVSVSTVRIAACIMQSARVTMKTERRSWRSAIMPAKGVMKKIGACETKETSAQQEHRMRQPVDQPGQRHRLDPGAYQRHRLAGEEQPVIAVPEHARQPLQPRRQGRCVWR